MNETWQKLGFDSPREYIRDRFYDEVELDPPRPQVCGDCDEWTRCNVKGHESVGWCSRWAEFMEENDERCE